MIARTARHQRLGDKAAKTVVVRRKRPQAVRAAGAAAPPAQALPVPQQPAPAAQQPAPAAGPEPASKQPQVAVGEPKAEPAAPAPTRPAPEAPEPKKGRRGLPGVSWSLSETIWGLLGGLLLALLVAPALILPFDPDFGSLAAKLAGQGLLGVCLLSVAFEIAAGWRRDALREAARRLGLRRFRGDAIGWMVVTLVGYYLAAALFAALFVAPEQEDIGRDLGLGGESVLAAAVAVILIVGLAPIAEELFFRGFLFGGLRTRLPLWPSALIAGAIFGLIHAPTGITAVVPLAMLGVGLSWLYEKTGSLWPPVILHTFNNALALAVAT
jgi:membrane protease YdiL (CAAX protease family)